MVGVPEGVAVPVVVAVWVGVPVLVGLPGTGVKVGVSKGVVGMVFDPQAGKRTVNRKHEKMAIPPKRIVRFMIGLLEKFRLVG
jgi:hypothetical protein